MTLTVTNDLPHDAVSTVEAFKQIKARRRSLEVEKLVLAAHLADLYGHIEAPVHVLPGQQRMVAFGGEGTPQVAEFCTLELAAVLDLRDVTVKSLVADALDLRHRLPRVWSLVLEGRVPVWHGRQMASATRVLDAHAAGLVDLQLARQVVGMTLRRVQELVDGLVLAHLPVEEAEERRQSALDSRGVWIGQMADGVAGVDAVLDVPDGLRLEAAVEKVSQVLTAGGAPGGRDARRAQALGLLASPARALNLLQADLLDELPIDHCAPSARRSEPASAPNPEPVEGTREDASCDSERVAQVEPGEAPLAQVLHEAQMIDLLALTPAQLTALEPRADLVVHISDETLVTGSGPARAPKVQPLLAEWLDQLLPGHHITVRPVSDANHQVPSDSYECPPTMREAVEYRNPCEVFPGSTRRSAGLDLDHTIAWTPRPSTPGPTMTPTQPPFISAGVGTDSELVDRSRTGPPDNHGASGSRSGGVTVSSSAQSSPTPSPPARPLTRPDNLGPLTRTVHRAKTHGGWSLHQPLPGHFLWQSPLGYRYLVTPSRTIVLGRPDAPARQRVT